MHEVSLLLFCLKSGFSTSEIKIFSSEIKIFSGSGGFFSGQVGARIGDLAFCGKPKL